MDFSTTVIAEIKANKTTHRLNFFFKKTLSIPIAKKIIKLRAQSYGFVKADPCTNPGKIG
jgi:hypothetical protein